MHGLGGLVRQKDEQDLRLIRNQLWTNLNLHYVYPWNLQ
jgi:hypothetical protein